MAAEAEKSDLGVDSFIGIDTVGLEDRYTPVMAGSYFKGIIQRRIAKLLFGSKLGSDKHLVEAFEDFTEIAQAYDMTKATTIRREAEVLRGTGMSGYFVWNSPLAKSGGKEALVNALENNPRMKARLLFAGKSTMGRLARVRPVVRELEARFPYQVATYEWPYDDENIGLAPQHPRTNEFIHDAIG
jgi:hypothetical protein